MTFPHKIGFMKPKGPVFCAQYQAVYNAMTNKPSAADATIQNTKMLAIVAGGRYAKSERHFEFSVHTNVAGEAQLDWIDPTGHLPVTNVNGCAWSAYNGFTGNSVGVKYLRSNFIPSVNGTLIGQNNICLIVGVGTDVLEFKWDFGAQNGGGANTQRLALSSRYNDKTYYYANNANSDSITNLNGKKYFALSRGAAANFDGYMNLVKTNYVRVSDALCSIELYICASNNAGVASICNRQLRFAEILSYLTEAEVLAEIGNENTYLSSYGTNLY